MPIIPAQIADVPEIAALVNSAYRGETSKQGWTSESHLLDGIRIDEEELKSYFAQSHITMLKCVSDTGEIIGSAYLEKVKDDKLYLGMLTVKPTLQAQGVGKQLLTATEDYARQHGCTTIKISVITTRKELIAWYERHGYKAAGQLLPFPTDTRFGIPKTTIELMVMEKPVG
ncbi:GNAT family N-acetyltransferase [Mucilaginibacter robiniae]|uniref:GNAT family N-acetyltransferase n=1 Tax=Mucilaginibacter robiniae TaxID=2728022 RepID=A0A7L5DVE1_9SPHI|nr:GNAT family N-acetyltransferase [Mucilaginibacter robiniae]QJD94691.1 GNAT family N-acetyltransferase [Mucilaginibacter robiniae]